MPNMQKVIIAGHLGRDPESRNTNSGKSVVNFSVAVSERGANEHTEWFNVVAWEKTGEMCMRLKKGEPVMLEGRLKTREYEAKDGTQKKVTELIADRMHFLGGKGGAAKTAGDDSGSDPF